jgi:hypothetical protein
MVRSFSLYWFWDFIEYFFATAFETKRRMYQGHREDKNGFVPFWNIKSSTWHERKVKSVPPNVDVKINLLSCIVSICISIYLYNCSIATFWYFLIESRKFRMYWHEKLLFCVTNIFLRNIERLATEEPPSGGEHKHVSVVQVATADVFNVKLIKLSLV